MAAFLSIYLPCEQSRVPQIRERLYEQRTAVQARLRKSRLSLGELVLLLAEGELEIVPKRPACASHADRAVDKD